MVSASVWPPLVVALSSIAAGARGASAWLSEGIVQSPEGPTKMGWIKGRYLWVRSGREASGVILVVGRKLGKAVTRNRLKRRLRNIFRELGPFQGSLVVFPRIPAVQARFSQLQEEFKELVSRI